MKISYNQTRIHKNFSLSNPLLVRKNGYLGALSRESSCFFRICRKCVYSGRFSELAT